jgi:hypothetical protein
MAELPKDEAFGELDFLLALDCGEEDIMKLIVIIIGLVFMINVISYAERPGVERTIYKSGDEWIFITAGGHSQ